MPALWRSDELEDEAVARSAASTGGARGVVPVAGVGRVAEKVRLRDQLEPRRLDLAAQHALLDAMEGLHVAEPGTDPRTVVDDAVDPSGPERREDRPVHAITVDRHPHGVVVEEHVQDGVERSRLGRQRVVELAIDPHDVSHNGFGEPRAPRHLGEPGQNEGRVLRVDHARGADRPREQLGRVASTSPQLGDAHAGSYAEEGEHRGWLPPRVEGPIGL